MKKTKQFLKGTVFRNMDIEKEVFKRTHPDPKKLKAYGFVMRDKQYFYEKDLTDGSFKAEISVDKDNKVSGKVIDKDLNEEYQNIRIDKAYGGFVGQIREEYISLLEDIRDKCFIRDPFIFPQTARIIEYIRKQYHDRPEFVWKQYPGYGVFRNSRSQRWYALIMNISASKLGLDNEEVEVLNVKAGPKTISELIDHVSFFEAYHMNKEKWLSILLNDSLDDEIIFSLIDQSYEYVDAADEWIVPANPKYYDVMNCFNKDGTAMWKQSSDIRPGDIVYMYVAQPYSAIMFKCIVEESDVPYEYKDKNITINRLMKLRLLNRYKEDKYPFSYLNELGIRAIRGPRRISRQISEKLK